MGFCSIHRQLYNLILVFFSEKGKEYMIIWQEIKRKKFYILLSKKTILKFGKIDPVLFKIVQLIDPTIRNLTRIKKSLKCL